MEYNRKSQKMRHDLKRGLDDKKKKTIVKKKKKKSNKKGCQGQEDH